MSYRKIFNYKFIKSFKIETYASIKSLTQFKT